MGRTETTTSLVPAGAGRTVDLLWPAQTDQVQNGVTPTGVCVNKITGALATSAALASTNGIPGFSTNTFGLGVVTATFGASIDGAGNGVKWSFDGFNARFTTQSPSTGTVANLSQFEQANAWRMIVICTIGANGPLGNVTDNGFGFCTVGSVTIDDGFSFQNKTPGIGFRLVAQDQMEAYWLKVAGNTPSHQVISAPLVGYKSADLHAYELRIIGAVGGQSAVAKWLIDGKLLFQRAWSVGDMPTTNVTWGGLRVTAGNNGGFSTSFGVKTLAFHGAQDEPNLF